MAINDISLTAGMRSNLVALQSTVNLLNRTQARLSSGKKVNSALDDPLSFFTAQTLNSRASDLSGYKNGMSEAVQTINAANNGITSLGSLIEQAKALAASAKASPLGGGDVQNYALTLSNVQNGNQVKIGNTTFTAVDAAHATQVNSSYDVNLTGAVALGSQISINGVTFTSSTGTGKVDGTHYDFTGATSANADAAALRTAVATAIGATDLAGVSASGATSHLVVNQAVAGTPAGTWVTAGPGAWGATVTQTPDWTQLTNTQFQIGATDAITAANLAEKANGTAGTQGAVAQNADHTVATALGSAITLTLGAGGSASQANFNDATRTAVVSGNSTMTSTATSNERKSYADQFVSLMTQFNNVAKDSGYKGVNFLDAGTLVLDFGGGHTLTMTGFDASAGATTMVGTAVADAATNNWASDANIAAAVTGLDAATATLKTQSSALSSNLSIINVRQDWTTSMINTLSQGADNLTLADMNQEGANMLMLQTRQSLGTTALSLSSQAAQSVLRLFA